MVAKPGVYVVEVPEWGRFRTVKIEDEIKKRKRRTAYRIILAVCVIITIMILASIVFSADLTDMEEWWEDDEDSDDKYGKCYNAGCVVYCNSVSDPAGPAKALNHLVNSTQFKNSCPNNGSINLNFHGTVFDNSILAPGWLDVPIRIQNLHIRSSEIISILPGAFMGNQFASTKSLLLDDNNLLSLMSGGFTGLRSLEHLGILNNEQLYLIQSNILSPVADTLQSLEIKYSIDNPKSITKLTGDVNLPKLRYVNFSNNSLSCLESSSFSGLVNPELILLDHCGLQKIPAEIFNVPAHNLKAISINNNNLTILPKNMLQYISNFNPSTKIFLSENPWHCECEFEWFQDALQNHTSLLNDETILTCKSPTRNAGKHVSEADFCSDSTITTATENSESIKFTSDVIESLLDLKSTLTS